MVLKSFLNKPNIHSVGVWRTFEVSTVCVRLTYVRVYDDADVSAWHSPVESQRNTFHRDRQKTIPRSTCRTLRRASRSYAARERILQRRAQRSWRVPVSTPWCCLVQHALQSVLHSYHTDIEQLTIGNTIKVDEIFERFERRVIRERRKECAYQC